MRLFVALPLSEEARSAIGAWARRCGTQSTLRWTPEEQLHITLHFLGEVAEERVSDITAALDVLRARAFDVAFEGIEVLGRAGVLSAAARISPPLSALEGEMRTRIFAFGEKRDVGREFHPHVTLARAKRGDAVPKLRTFPEFPALTYRAACFRLYRSELRREGAVHTVIREWKLS